eukprot:TRINITY_DN1483_c0_g1_i3.p2 TRINITY_DN1483_c0_g1~~TRINITY_DN1483_c0_g1_i3.p2  ORF type:complete len:117 (+),score=45.26 TRINITY_DN1483_c0_g1_i3:43-393(+)
MATRNLSGVCVLDETKTSWIATTTGSDLKLYLAQPCLELLQQPILSFLNAIRQSELETRNPTIGVRPTATLKHVINKLVATKVHRVFVGDENHHPPSSVIALTDILRYIIPFSRHH